jgi:hypothetical protein
MECEFYRKRIKTNLAGKTSHNAIAREIYLSYPTFSFADSPEKEFAIRNSISKQFEVDFLSVQFGGSAKTGESYHKLSSFEFGKSDLDAAIISQHLFLKYLELTCEITDSFSDLTSFDPDAAKIAMFKKYVLRGIFIPELMPNCDVRLEWNSFFNNLSQGNLDLFDNINCWIYSSQKLFEIKFAKTIRLLEG